LRESSSPFSALQGSKDETKLS